MDSVWIGRVKACLQATRYSAKGIYIHTHTNAYVSVRVLTHFVVFELHKIYACAI